MGKTGDRQIDPLPCQQLQRTQLVARTSDRHRLIKRITAQQFKLAQHCSAIKGHGGADARDHRVVTLQLAAAIVDSRRGRVDVHIAREWIDNLDAVAALFRRLHQAFT
ncbi:hypothetical protein D3C75_1004230 [compost metagenome]